MMDVNGHTPGWGTQVSLTGRGVHSKSACFKSILNVHKDIPWTNRARFSNPF